MRVLLTNTASWGTGSGMVAEGISNQLRQLGHEAIVVFLDSGNRDGAAHRYYNTPSQYRVIEFPASFNGIELPREALMFEDPHPRSGDQAWTYKHMTKEQFSAYFGYLKQGLEQILADFQPDIIECEHIWAMDHVIDELNHRFICTAHHSDQLAYAYDERMQPIAKQSAHNSQYIFAISDAVRDDVIKLYDVEPEKVVTISNGYNQDIFKIAEHNRAAVLKEFDIEIPSDMPVITFGGKISKTKGVDILLRANRSIQEQCEALIVMTGPGDFSDSTASEQADFCLKNTIFPGHISQEQLARLHNIARLNVMPSRAEGFGLAALEAMACGLPIAATAVGGLPDFAVGRLVESENPEALADAVLELLNLNSSDYDDLCRKAGSRAREYSWDTVVSQRITYYEAAERNGAS